MTAARAFHPGFDDQPHLPKYQRLAQWLERQIADGAFAPDSALPTEEALCEQFGLSRGTVQQAIQGLVSKGLIRREQGRGSFVNPARQPDVTSFTLVSFDELTLRQGRAPGTRLLVAAIQGADPAVAARLNLAAETPVVKIERLRLADGQPIAWEQRFLAQALAPDLLSQNLERDSIHSLLVETYQIPLVRLEHTIELAAAPIAIAALLHVTPEQPLFFVDRLSYTRRGDERIPAVWFRAYYHEHSWGAVRPG